LRCSKTERQQVGPAVRNTTADKTAHETCAARAPKDAQIRRKTAATPLLT